MGYGFRGFAALLTSTFLLGCSTNYGICVTPGVVSQGVATTSGSTPTGTGGTTTTTSVQSLKPALALRGINCLLCHGSIVSNVVTDFGHNSDANGLVEF